MAENGNENYKGQLQEYCHTHYLTEPEYESTQQGPANAPSWEVTVTYGQSSYTTPEPIPGTKRSAEQTAAKQVLDSIESWKQAFVSGEPLEELDGRSDVIPDSEPVEPQRPKTGTEKIAGEIQAPEPPTDRVPLGLMTAALQIAADRICLIAPDEPEVAEGAASDRDFAQRVARLAVRLVQESRRAAREAQLEIDPFNQ